MRVKEIFICRESTEFMDISVISMRQWYTAIERVMSGKGLGDKPTRDDLKRLYYDSELNLDVYGYDYESSLIWEIDFMDKVDSIELGSVPLLSLKTIFQAFLICLLLQGIATSNVLFTQPQVQPMVIIPFYQK